ncbi:MAG: OB-fold nucleic acid binding domain-containing protein, partial [Chloroflexota bacterium]
MLRSAECGSLREKDVDTRPTLAGWVSRRRDHGGIIFVDLRDSSGLVQVVFNPELSPAACQVASQLRPEWVVQVKGLVRRRPPGSENPAMATGGVEVVADEATVLNRSLTPPFYIAE